MQTRCPPFVDERHADADTLARLATRRERALAAARAGAGPDFVAGATAAIRFWHRELFAGTTPLDGYAGGVRGEGDDAGCLRRNVSVEGRLATRWSEMAEALGDFDRGARERLAAGDEAWARGTARAARVAAEGVAWVMAEVLRIHPFLNGNGRVARLAMHALLQRYGLRSEGIAVSPAPRGAWPELARRAVTGDIRPLRNYILDDLGMFPRDEVAG